MNGEVKLPVFTPDELVAKLNNFSNNNSIGLGTEELDDFTNLFYGAAEAYEKSMANGVLELEDALYLNKVVFGLFGAFTGATQSLAEALDLTDQEITDQVALGDNYQLGISAAKYKQIWKEILMKFQTYSVFTK